MSISITTTTSEKFTKIEEALKIFDEDFVNNFSKAGYVIEGYCDDIKLIAINYYKDKITLPRDFKIDNIKFDDKIIYNKNSENEIEEKQIYEIEIQGQINGQIYRFLFTELSKPNKEISYY